MPMVYVLGEARTHRVFHRDETCYYVTRSSREPSKVDLTELKSPRPCLACYSNAPRAKSFHRFCKICNKSRVYPCPHNGGVPVVIEMTRRSTKTLFTEPGDAWQRVVWTWPERARHYVR